MDDTLKAVYALFLIDVILVVAVILSSLDQRNRIKPAGILTRVATDTHLILGNLAFQLLVDLDHFCPARDRRRHHRNAQGVRSLPTLKLQQRHLFMCVKDINLAQARIAHVEIQYAKRLEELI